MGHGPKDDNPLKYPRLKAQAGNPNCLTHSRISRILVFSTKIFVFAKSLGKVTLWEGYTFWEGYTCWEGYTLGWLQFWEGYTLGRLQFWEGKKPKWLLGEFPSIILSTILSVLGIVSPVTLIFSFLSQYFPSSFNNISCVLWRLGSGGRCQKGITSQSVSDRKGL